jgi:hypothetical protein
MAQILVQHRSVWCFAKIINVSNNIFPFVFLKIIIIFSKYQISAKSMHRKIKLRQHDTFFPFAALNETYELGVFYSVCYM